MLLNGALQPQVVVPVEKIVEKKVLKEVTVVKEVCVLLRLSSLSISQSVKLFIVVNTIFFSLTSYAADMCLHVLGFVGDRPSPDKF
jgi:hypothetical protein